MKRLKESSGFSLIEAVVIIGIVAFMGGVGWYVWDSRQDKTQSAPTSASDQESSSENDSEETAYKIPDGYRYYENRDIGFKFAYPTDYKEVTTSATETGSQTLTSSEPIPTYVEGSTDAIKLTILSDPSAVFLTLKYGPHVKFIDGELIVQDVNPADEVNKVGQPYKGWLSVQDVVKEVGGLKVYVMKGGDEGHTYYKYAFLLNDHVVIISLPGFYDGTAICPQAECKANDQAPYDEFGARVLESISKIL